MAIDVCVTNPHSTRANNGLRLLWREHSQGVSAVEGRNRKWETKITPRQDPPVLVRDALKRVGGRLQPAVLEIHGAMDYQFTKLINQICQRAKVFRGYSASYFRRFCYETVGHALFKGQYDRCLNKATSEGQSGRPEEARETVTCTDDLGVTLSHAEAEVLHEQSISSIVRTEFIRG